MKGVKMVKRVYLIFMECKLVLAKLKKGLYRSLNGDKSPSQGYVI